MDLLNSIVNLIIYFSIASFIGWCIETVYRSIKSKRFVNAGFLHGSFLPIYGTGAILIYLSDLAMGNLNILIKIPVWLIVTSALEYLSSLILEKIFSIKLWDYKNLKFNLHGRISLKHSFFWVILSVFAVYVVQPLAFNLIEKTNNRLSYFLAGMFMTYFILDIVFSARLYGGILEFIKAPTLTFVHLGENVEKLPFYLRRMIRPLTSFPNLMKGFLSKENNLPEALIEKIKKMVYGRRE